MSFYIDNSGQIHRKRKIEDGQKESATTDSKNENVGCWAWVFFLSPALLSIAISLWLGSWIPILIVAYLYYRFFKD